MTGAGTEDVLAICLLGFGVLQVDLRRGDVREQLSYLRPEFGRTKKQNKTVDWNASRGNLQV